jgi:hypothetical protein
MATKKRVFVSFDFDNDQFLKESLIGQSKLEDSPFDIIDGSLKEAAPEKDWLEKARLKIKAADIVVVMLGKETYKAPGVKKEVIIANELKKPIFQLIGYKNRICTAVDNAGKRYDWTWPNLKILLK